MRRCCLSSARRLPAASRSAWPVPAPLALTSPGTCSWRSPRPTPEGITPGVTAFRPGAEGRYDQLRFIPWGFLDLFYTAVVQGAEEAVLNALVANEDMTGRPGHRTPALPRDRVARLLSARHG